MENLNKILTYQKPILRSYVFYIKMQIKIDYGKALYIIGNYDSIGSWQIQRAFKMTWNEDNLWRGSFRISGGLPIQYKYIIADYQKPEQGSVTWENGNNRIIYLCDIQKNQIYLNERWNKLKIRLQLFTKIEEHQYQIFIIGNIVELGIWASKRHMKKQKSYTLQKNKQIWTLSFFIQKQKQYIHYYFIKKFSNKIIKQREPGRVFYLHTNIKNKLHSDDKIDVHYKAGQILIRDQWNFNEIKISEVNNDICIGGYLQSENEISHLKKKNINAVINLQTKQDMKKYGVDWATLSAKYTQNNIYSYNIEIVDMKIQDFVNKCGPAIELMRYLIQNSKRIYVHCTAGIYRSTQLVAVYLILYQKYHIDQAIEYIKIKRPEARPVKKCIQSALNRINKKKLISETELSTNDEYNSHQNEVE